MDAFASTWNSQRHKQAAWLLRAAWAIEILAAAVGLFIAWAQAYAAYDEIVDREGALTTSGNVNVILGALPFVMVAVVELTKIPIASAVYHSTRIMWRLVFLFTLLFLVAITFETALNGFERNFTSVTRAIESEMRKQSSFKSKIGDIGQRSDDLRETSEKSAREQFAQRSAQLQQERQEKLAEFDRQSSTTTGNANEATTAGLQIQLQALDKRSDQIQRDYEGELKRIDADFDSAVQRSQGTSNSSRTTLETQIADIERSTNQLNLEETRKIEVCPVLALTCAGSIRDEYRKRRDDLASQGSTLRAKLTAQAESADIGAFRQERDRKQASAKASFDAGSNQLNAERQNINGQISRRLGQTQSDLQRTLAAINEEKSRIRTQYDQLQKDNERLLSERLADLARQEDRARQLDLEKESLTASLLATREEIARRVGDNQVYRITQLWTGKEHAADVSKDDLRFTGFVWFGSIAAIVAATGVLMAFASFVLADERNYERKRSAVGVAIRRALLGYRRHLREPKIIKQTVEVERIVEVTKEVPVDRIVTRDVPREVVRKELVYVPLYTNDKELLADPHTSPSASFVRPVTNSEA
jgi:hypothetical protein